MANQMTRAKCFRRACPTMKRPWAVPNQAGPWIGSAQAGTFMAVGILAALHWRAMTGEGEAFGCASAEVTPLWRLGSGVVSGGRSVNERFAACYGRLAILFRADKEMALVFWAA